MDGEYFTIPYVTDTILNSPAGRQLPTQDKLNVWNIYINGENPIIYQGALDKINFHQFLCGKSKVNISLCRRNIYQIVVPDLNKSDLWFHILKFVS